MKKHLKILCGLSLALLTTSAQAQMASPAIQAHIDTAMKAAFFNWMGLFASQCGSQAPHLGNYATDPGREKWYAEPQKVFDNLYFLGTRYHTSWAVDTGAGIVIIDTLYSYAIEPEIIDGLKKLRLDPKQIKYVFITHAHGDHDQGAALLQKQYGAHVVMGAPDWDVVATRIAYPGGTPKRDLDAADGGKLTIGNTTFTQYLTPPHSPGDYGLLFEVKDHGRPVSVVYPSGTAMRFTKEFFPTFIASLDKMSAAAKSAKATVLLSNHTAFDNAWTLARLAAWRPKGTPNPFEIGQEAVQRYFTVMRECALAGQLWMDTPDGEKRQQEQQAKKP